MSAGPQKLQTFYGPARGFSFPQEIQPILDRHCISCHKDRDRHMDAARIKNALTLQPDPDWSAAPRQPLVIPGADLSSHGSGESSAFSLLSAGTRDRMAKRTWSDSYLNLTLSYPDRDEWARGAARAHIDGRIVNWNGSQSIPAPLPPYAAGSTQSRLIALLEAGHEGVRLSREEMDKLCCWIDLYVPYCGDYTEANAWTDAEMAKYQHFLAKRRRMEEIERRNIEELLESRASAH